MTDGALKMLSKQECIDTFAEDYVSGHRMVILLTNTSLPDNEPLVYLGEGNSEDIIQKDRSYYKWICDNNVDCTKAMAKRLIDSWSVHGGWWSVSDMQLLMPTPTGFRFASSTYSLYPGRDGIPDTEDYHQIFNILNGFPDEMKLRADLNNPTNWVNTTFARDIKIEGHEPICGPKDSRIVQPPQKYPIEGCFALPAEETCQLSFNPPIGLIVICCTICKLICAILTARDQRDEILLTVGDAIASFLTHPDPTTKGACLLSKSSVGTQGWRKSRGQTYEYPVLRQNEKLPRHLPLRAWWFQSVDKTHWAATLTLYAILLFLVK